MVIARSNRVLLFDIDDTLLWAGGVGLPAFNQVFRDMFGTGFDDGFEWGAMRGRTDLSILTESFTIHGIPGRVNDHLDEIYERLDVLLPDLLAKAGGRLLPGFPHLLDKLSAMPGVCLGVVTGNGRRPALSKLTFFGLDQYFAGGAYGDEAVERAEVVRLAVKRLAGGLRENDVFVIGDTPLDIAAARENGVVSVGVATGRSAVRDLSEAGAHLIFDDFSDWVRAASILTEFRVDSDPAA